jgi:hypothetical protein
MRTALLILLLSPLASAQDSSQWVVPSFNDLKIKTRETRGLMTPQVSSWYFKGARERNEHGPAAARPGFIPFLISILECDQKASIRLHPHFKTYTISVAHESASSEERHRPNRPLADGPDVTISIDSVDTGETKPIGSYQARHLKTTFTIQPSKGAASKPGKVEADSWYLEIPGLGCHQEPSRFEWTRLYAPLLSHEYSEHRDHIEIKKNGAEPRGLVIEETVRELSDGNRIVNRTELVEVSADLLDQSLFEIPPDFTHVEPGHVLERTSSMR